MWHYWASTHPPKDKDRTPGPVQAEAFLGKQEGITAPKGAEGTVQGEGKEWGGGSSCRC